MSTKTPLRIGLDLDGVCYDFVDSLRRFLISTGHDPARLTDAQTWEFFTTWGLSLDEFVAACHAGVDAGIVFATGDPYPDTAAAVARILAAGHEIHVVTDRSFGQGSASRDATVAWLAAHGIAYTSLTISADKTAVACDFFIEDRDKNYLALDAAGVNAYLINRPWNAHVTTDRRVTTLHEFADIVLAA